MRFRESSDSIFLRIALGKRTVSAYKLFLGDNGEMGRGRRWAIELEEECARSENTDVLGVGEDILYFYTCSPHASPLFFLVPPQ